MTCVYETPNYLNFKDKLFQLWLNQYTILLVLVVIKLYLYKLLLINCLENLSELMKATITLFNEANINSNELIKKMIVASVNDVKRQSLYFISLLINVIIGLIKFLINLFFGTFLCLIENFINAFIDFALDLVDTILNVTNEIIQASTVIIAKALSGISTVIDKLSDSINSISKFFSNNDAVDTSNLIDEISSSVAKLNNFSLPDSVFQTIKNLQSKIPDFDDVEDDALDVIVSPIKTLLSHFNESEIFNSFDADYKNAQVINMSSKSVDDFFDETVHAVDSSFKIILIVLVVLSVLVLVPIFFKECSNWKRKYELYVDVNARVSSSHLDEFSTLNLFNTYSNDFLFYLKKFKIDIGNDILWIFSYISSTYSVVVLKLVVLGTLSILFQLVLFDRVKTQLDEFPSSSLGKDLKTVTRKNTEAYVESTNEFIKLQQKNMNDELFGSIKNTSAEISDALDYLIGSLNKTLIEPFEDTPLNASVSTIVYCVITRKIIMVNNGLLWIQNNLEISIPSISKNIVKTNAAIEIDLSKHSDKLIAYLTNSLWTEAWVVIGLFSCWLLQLLIGVGLFFYKRTRTTTIGAPNQLTLRQKFEYGLPFNKL